MLLNDKVSFRMQWPQYADLQVNGMLCLFFSLIASCCLIVEDGKLNRDIFTEVPYFYILF